MEEIQELLAVCVELAGGPGGCMDCPPDCFDRPRGPSMREVAKPKIEKILGEMGLPLDEVEREVRKRSPGFTLREPGFGACLTPLEFVGAVRRLIEQPTPVG